VVIADGGSRDGTVAAIEAWGKRQAFPVRVLSVPGANISQGRNASIRAAAGPLIASTDAGVRLDARWMAELVQGAGGTGQGASVPMIQNAQRSAVSGQPSTAVPHLRPKRGAGRPDGVRREASPCPVPRAPSVVSGFFVPDPQNAFEMAMSATVLPALEDINPQAFLPSSRSILFAKDAWQAVGGYPEWLDYCEDLVYDFALRERYAFVFVPQAIAYFRPRGGLRSFFRQYSLYARGDGKADLWRKRHAIRYATYLVGVPVLVALAFVNPPWGFGLALLGLLIGGYLYTRTPYRRLRGYWPRMTLAERIAAAALAPVIRVVGDIAKMIGYPVGVWWRMQRESQRTQGNPQ
jgi:glycosyltransferase involved in cell wall biosynthesis